MSTELFARCVLTVQADLDPTVGARILGLVTVAGDIPESFSACRRAGSLHIVLELREPPPAKARLLAERIRNIPAVVGVDVAWSSRQVRRSA